MASYKVVTNKERHFSIDSLLQRAIHREVCKVVPTGTLLNWTKVHSRPHCLHWIRQGEDYYIVVERIANERNVL